MTDPSGNPPISIGDQPICIDLGDGIKRSLVFDLNSLEDVYQLTGENPLDGEFWSEPAPDRRKAMFIGRNGDERRKNDTGNKKSRFGPGKVRALVFCGMQDRDPALTIEQLGKMIGPRQLKKVTAAVTQAFNTGDESAENPS